MKTLNRVIMDNATELKFKDSKLKVYIREIDNKWICQIFTGRKTKPTTYTRFRTFEAMDNEINKQVQKEINDNIYKRELAETRRLNKIKLKNDLVPGVTIRTSFSYNMTYNKFYKFISKKGNTLKLEVLETEWVDGDKGWTGNVKAGAQTGTFIEGKISNYGVKIDGLTGGIVSPDTTFYENHMD